LALHLTDPGLRDAQLLSQFLGVADLHTGNLRRIAPF
jgi:hypothetical protein